MKLSTYFAYNVLLSIECRQLLGDFVPRHPTGASPMDPTGGLPSECFTGSTTPLGLDENFCDTNADARTICGS